MEIHTTLLDVAKFERSDGYCYWIHERMGHYTYQLSTKKDKYVSNVLHTLTYVARSLVFSSHTFLFSDPLHFTPVHSRILQEKKRVK